MMNFQGLGIFRAWNQTYLMAVDIHHPACHPRKCKVIKFAHAHTMQTTHRVGHDILVRFVFSRTRCIRNALVGIAMVRTTSMKSLIVTVRRHHDRKRVGHPLTAWRHDERVGGRRAGPKTVVEGARTPTAPRTTKKQPVRRADPKSVPGTAQKKNNLSRRHAVKKQKRRTADTHHENSYIDKRLQTFYCKIVVIMKL